MTSLKGAVSFSGAAALYFGGGSMATALLVIAVPLLLLTRWHAQVQASLSEDDQLTPPATAPPAGPRRFMSLLLAGLVGLTGANAFVTQDAVGQGGKPGVEQAKTVLAEGWSVTRAENKDGKVSFVPAEGEPPQRRADGKVTVAVVLDASHLTGRIQFPVQDPPATGQELAVDFVPDASAAGQEARLVLEDVNGNTMAGPNMQLAGRLVTLRARAVPPEQAAADERARPAFNPAKVKKAFVQVQAPASAFAEGKMVKSVHTFSSIRPRTPGQVSGAGVLAAREPDGSWTVDARFGNGKNNVEIPFGIGLADGQNVQGLDGKPSTPQMVGGTLNVLIEVPEMFGDFYRAGKTPSPNDDPLTRQQKLAGDDEGKGGDDEAKRDLPHTVVVRVKAAGKDVTLMANVPRGGGLMRVPFPLVAGLKSTSPDIFNRVVSVPAGADLNQVTGVSVVVQRSQLSAPTYEATGANAIKVHSVYWAPFAQAAPTDPESFSENSGINWMDAWIKAKLGWRVGSRDAAAGFAANVDELNRIFTIFAQAKKKLVRVPIFFDMRADVSDNPYERLFTRDAEGRITGFVHPEQVMADLKALFDAAERHGLRIMPILFSYQVGDNVVLEMGANGVRQPVGEFAADFNDPAALQAMVDNVISPLAERFNKHKALWGWDLMNESRLAPAIAPGMQNYVRAAAKTIHKHPAVDPVKNQPRTAVVTVGEQFGFDSEVMWSGLGADENGKKYVDVVQGHYFRYFNKWADWFSGETAPNPLDENRGWLTAPVVSGGKVTESPVPFLLGEYATDRPEHTVTDMESFRRGGGAGFLGWPTDPDRPGLVWDAGYYRSAMERAGVKMTDIPLPAWAEKDASCAGCTFVPDEKAPLKVSALRGDSLDRVYTVMPAVRRIQVQYPSQPAFTETLLGEMTATGPSSVTYVDRRDFQPAVDAPKGDFPAGFPDVRGAAPVVNRSYQDGPVYWVTRPTGQGRFVQLTDLSNGLDPNETVKYIFHGRVTLDGVTLNPDLFVKMEKPFKIPFPVFSIKNPAKNHDALPWLKTSEMTMERAVALLAFLQKLPTSVSAIHGWAGYDRLDAGQAPQPIQIWGQTLNQLPAGTRQEVVFSHDSKGRPSGPPDVKLVYSPEVMREGVGLAKSLFGIELNLKREADAETAGWLITARAVLQTRFGQALNPGSGLWDFMAALYKEAAPFYEKLPIRAQDVFGSPEEFRRKLILSRVMFEWPKRLVGMHAKLPGDGLAGDEVIGLAVKDISGLAPEPRAKRLAEIMTPLKERLSQKRFLEIRDFFTDFVKGDGNASPRGTNWRDVHPFEGVGWSGYHAPDLFGLLGRMTDGSEQVVRDSLKHFAENGLTLINLSPALALTKEGESISIAEDGRVIFGPTVESDMEVYLGLAREAGFAPDQIVVTLLGPDLFNGDTKDGERPDVLVNAAKRANFVKSFQPFVKKFGKKAVFSVLGEPGAATALKPQDRIAFVKEMADLFAAEAPGATLFLDAYNLDDLQSWTKLAGAYDKGKKVNFVFSFNVGANEEIRTQPDAWDFALPENTSIGLVSFGSQEPLVSRIRAAREKGYTFLLIREAPDKPVDLRGVSLVLSGDVAINSLGLSPEDIFYDALARTELSPQLQLETIKKILPDISESFQQVVGRPMASTPHALKALLELSDALRAMPKEYREDVLKAFRISLKFPELAALVRQPLLQTEAERVYMENARMYAEMIVKKGMSIRDNIDNYAEIRALINIRSSLKDTEDAVGYYETETRKARLQWLKESPVVHGVAMFLGLYLFLAALRFLTGLVRRKAPQFPKAPEAAIQTSETGRNLAGASTENVDDIIQRLIFQGRMLELIYDKNPDPEADVAESLIAYKVEFVSDYKPGKANVRKYRPAKNKLESKDFNEILSTQEQKILMDWIKTHPGAGGKPVRFRLAKGEAALAWQGEAEHSAFSQAGRADNVIYIGDKLLKYMLQNTPAAERLREDVLEKDELLHLTDPNFKHKVGDAAHAALVKRVGEAVKETRLSAVGIGELTGDFMNVLWEAHRALDPERYVDNKSVLFAPKHHLTTPKGIFGTLSLFVGAGLSAMLAWAKVKPFLYDQLIPYAKSLPSWLQLEPSSFPVEMAFVDMGVVATAAAFLVAGLILNRRAMFDRLNLLNRKARQQRSVEIMDSALAELEQRFDAAFRNVDDAEAIYTFSAQAPFGDPHDAIHVKQMRIDFRNYLRHTRRWVDFMKERHAKNDFSYNIITRTHYPPHDPQKKAYPTFWVEGNFTTVGRAESQDKSTNPAGFMGVLPGQFTEDMAQAGYVDLSDDGKHSRRNGPGVYKHGIQPMPLYNLYIYLDMVNERNQIVKRQGDHAGARAVALDQLDGRRDYEISRTVDAIKGLGGVGPRRGSYEQPLEAHRFSLLSWMPLLAALGLALVPLKEKLRTAVIGVVFNGDFSLKLDAFRKWGEGLTNQGWVDSAFRTVADGLPSWLRVWGENFPDFTLVNALPILFLVAGFVFSTVIMLQKLSLFKGILGNNERMLNADMARYVPEHILAQALKSIGVANASASNAAGIVRKWDKTYTDAKMRAKIGKTIDGKKIEHFSDLLPWKLQLKTPMASIITLSTMSDRDRLIRVVANRLNAMKEESNDPAVRAALEKTIVAIMGLPVETNAEDNKDVLNLLSYDEINRIIDMENELPRNASEDKFLFPRFVLMDTTFGGDSADQALAMMKEIKYPSAVDIFMVMDTDDGGGHKSFGKAFAPGSGHGLSENGYQERIHIVPLPQQGLNLGRERRGALRDALRHPINQHKLRMKPTLNTETMQYVKRHYALNGERPANYLELVDQEDIPGPLLFVNKAALWSMRDRAARLEAKGLLSKADRKRWGFKSSYKDLQKEHKKNIRKFDKEVGALRAAEVRKIVAQTRDRVKNEGPYLKDDHLPDLVRKWRDGPWGSDVETAEKRAMYAMWAYLQTYGEDPTHFVASELDAREVPSVMQTQLRLIPSEKEDWSSYAYMDYLKWHETYQVGQTREGFLFLGGTGNGFRLSMVGGWMPVFDPQTREHLGDRPLSSRAELQGYLQPLRDKIQSEESFREHKINRKGLLGAFGSRMGLLASPDKSINRPARLLRETLNVYSIYGLWDPWQIIEDSEMGSRGAQFKLKTTRLTGKFVYILEDLLPDTGVAWWKQRSRWIIPQTISAILSFQPAAWMFIGQHVVGALGLMMFSSFSATGVATGLAAAAVGWLVGGIVFYYIGAFFYVLRIRMGFARSAHMDVDPIRTMGWLTFQHVAYLASSTMAAFFAGLTAKMTIIYFAGFMMTFAGGHLGAMGNLMSWLGGNITGFVPLSQPHLFGPMIGLIFLVIPWVIEILTSMIVAWIKAPEDEESLGHGISDQSKNTLKSVASDKGTLAGYIAELDDVSGRDPQVVLEVRNELLAEYFGNHPDNMAYVFRSLPFDVKDFDPDLLKAAISGLDAELQRRWVLSGGAETSPQEIVESLNRLLDRSDITAAGAADVPYHERRALNREYIMAQLGAAVTKTDFHTLDRKDLRRLLVHFRNNAQAVLKAAESTDFTKDDTAMAFFAMWEERLGRSKVWGKIRNRVVGAVNIPKWAQLTTMAWIALFGALFYIGWINVTWMATAIAIPLVFVVIPSVYFLGYESLFGQPKPLGRYRYNKWFRFFQAFYGPLYFSHMYPASLLAMHRTFSTYVNTSFWPRTSHEHAPIDKRGSLWSQFKTMAADYTVNKGWVHGMILSSLGVILGLLFVSRADQFQFDGVKETLIDPRVNQYIVGGNETDKIEVETLLNRVATDREVAANLSTDYLLDYIEKFKDLDPKRDPRHVAMVQVGLTRYQEILALQIANGMSYGQINGNRLAFLQDLRKKLGKAGSPAMQDLLLRRADGDWAKALVKVSLVNGQHKEKESQDRAYNAFQAAKKAIGQYNGLIDRISPKEADSLKSEFWKSMKSFIQSLGFTDKEAQDITVDLFKDDKKVPIEGAGLRGLGRVLAAVTILPLATVASHVLTRPQDVLTSFGADILVLGITLASTIFVLAVSGSLSRSERDIFEGRRTVRMVGLEHKTPLSARFTDWLLTRSTSSMTWGFTANQTLDEMAVYDPATDQVFAHPRLGKYGRLTQYFVLLHELGHRWISTRQGLHWLVYAMPMLPVWTSYLGWGAGLLTGHSLIGASAGLALGSAVNVAFLLLRNLGRKPRAHLARGAGRAAQGYVDVTQDQIISERPASGQRAVSSAKPGSGPVSSARSTRDAENALTPVNWSQVLDKFLLLIKQEPDEKFLDQLEGAKDFHAFFRMSLSQFIAHTKRAGFVNARIDAVRAGSAHKDQEVHEALAENLREFSDSVDDLLDQISDTGSVLDRRADLPILSAMTPKDRPGHIHDALAGRLDEITQQTPAETEERVGVDEFIFNGVETSVRTTDGVFLSVVTMDRDARELSYADAVAAPGEVDPRAVHQPGDCKQCGVLKNREKELLFGVTGEMWEDPYSYVIAAAKLPQADDHVVAFSADTSRRRKSHVMDDHRLRDFLLFTRGMGPDHSTWFNSEGGGAVHGGHLLFNSARFRAKPADRAAGDTRDLPLWKHVDGLGADALEEARNHNAVTMGYAADWPSTRIYRSFNLDALAEILMADINHLYGQKIPMNLVARLTAKGEYEVAMAAPLWDRVPEKRRALTPAGLPIVDLVSPKGRLNPGAATVKTETIGALELPGGRFGMVGHNLPNLKEMPEGDHIIVADRAQHIMRTTMRPGPWGVPSENLGKVVKTRSAQRPPDQKQPDVVRMKHPQQEVRDAWVEHALEVADEMGVPADREEDVKVRARNVFPTSGPIDAGREEALRQALNNLVPQDNFQSIPAAAQVRTDTMPSERNTIPVPASPRDLFWAVDTLSDETLEDWVDSYEISLRKLGDEPSGDAIGRLRFNLVERILAVKGLVADAKDLTEKFFDDRSQLDMTVDILQALVVFLEAKGNEATPSLRPSTPGMGAPVSSRATVFARPEIIPDAAKPSMRIPAAPGLPKGIEGDESFASLNAPDPDEVSTPSRMPAATAISGTPSANETPTAPPVSPVPQTSFVRNLASPTVSQADQDAKAIEDATNTLFEVINEIWMQAVPNTPEELSKIASNARIRGAVSAVNKLVKTNPEAGEAFKASLSPLPNQDPIKRVIAEMARMAAEAREAKRKAEAEKQKTGKMNSILGRVPGLGWADAMAYWTGGIAYYEAGNTLESDALGLRAPTLSLDPSAPFVTHRGYIVGSPRWKAVMAVGLLAPVRTLLTAAAFLALAALLPGALDASPAARVLSLAVATVGLAGWWALGIVNLLPIAGSRMRMALDIWTARDTWPALDKAVRGARLSNATVTGSAMETFLDALLEPRPLGKLTDAFDVNAVRNENLRQARESDLLLGELVAAVDQEGARPLAILSEGAQPSLPALVNAALVEKDENALKNLIVLLSADGGADALALLAYARRAVDARAAGRSDAAQVNREFANVATLGRAILASGQESILANNVSDPVAVSVHFTQRDLEDAEAGENVDAFSKLAGEIRTFRKLDAASRANVSFALLRRGVADADAADRLADRVVDVLSERHNLTLTAEEQAALVVPATGAQQLFTSAWVLAAVNTRRAGKTQVQGMRGFSTNFREWAEEDWKDLIPVGRALDSLYEQLKAYAMTASHA